MLRVKFNMKMRKGLTIGELMIASAIAVIVVGGAYALWFMAQDSWMNERAKSEILQELQVSIERIKRDIQLSDASRMFFHTAAGGSYDATSLPIALDDGRSNAGYNASQDDDGFIETDSSTLDPITGVEKIYWDKTVIYHVYNNEGAYELRRTDFYPRDNSLSDTQRQTQIDNVVSLGTGNDSTVSNNSNWQNTRAIFKASSISFDVSPRMREFDGYSSATERTENLIGFGSAILTGGYHTIEFRVTDKNAASTGYALGVDSLKLTPPGSTREAENYKYLTQPDSSSGISASSGDTITNVEMHDMPEGIWSADYYMDYAANEIDDYITLRFYYDRWYETTFLDSVPDNLVVEFSNSDGSRSGSSGNEEYLVRLEGNKITWEAEEQTNTEVIGAQNHVLPANTTNVSFRNIVRSNHTSANGRLVSVKFRAAGTNDLTIQEAYIIQRDDSDSGTGLPYDGSTDMPSIPITFNSCNIDPRNQGQPTLPSAVNGGAGAFIAAGGYAWSNWIELKDNTNSPFNLDKTKDYLISFYIKTDGFAAQSILYWQDPTLSPTDDIDKKHAYIIEVPYDEDTSYAQTRLWSATGKTPSEELSSFGVEKLDVTYVDSGSLNSQIFDTGIDDPSYGTLNWTSTANSPDATLQIRARSSDSKTGLLADGDWTTVTGQAFTTSPASLGGIGNGRYAQFRAEFTALASGMNSSHITDDTDDTYPGDEDYDLSYVLKDVSIYWPGSTAMVDVGGHFTKKSNYGKFTVKIDGEELTKGYVLNLTIIEELATGTTVDRSITAEVEPRNTNK